MHHLVLEDEAPAELEDLTARLMAEVAPMSEIEAKIARRLAIAFWKGERAERMEVALFDAAPRTRPQGNGFYKEDADPLTTFDVRRFNAVRGYQAQQGREIGRFLKELRDLRKDALAAGTDEPEPLPENEPESPPAAANDDMAHTTPPGAVDGAVTARNEPEDRRPTDLGAHDQPVGLLQPWPAGAGRSDQAAGTGPSPALARAR